MVTELKLRVAKYYDYAFSGEGTYSNVVHSECADVSQGAVYPVHALCLLVWVQSEHSWENPFCRPPNLIKLSPALRHELSTIFHKVYVFYESRTLSLFRSLENGSKSSLLRNFPGVFVPTISFRQSCKGERDDRVWPKRYERGGGSSPLFPLWNGRQPSHALHDFCRLTCTKPECSMFDHSLPLVQEDN